ncbi:MAG: PEP-CTERM sorting domain-containing protein [Thermodesulfobacteriota bacterium]
MKSLYNRILVLTIIPLLLAVSAVYPADYLFSPLNLPDGGYGGDINNLDQIVGINDGQGFIKDGPTFTTFSPVGAALTAARGINDNGLIVGVYFDGLFVAHGFMKNGINYTILNFPGSITTSAYGINNSGVIVGEYELSNMHGFMTTDGVNFNPLDYPGSTSSRAFGINNTGKIVGEYRDAGGIFHGYLYDGGNFTPINFPLASNTHAYGINDKGQVVGSYENLSGEHGFIKDGNNYTTIDFPSTAITRAYGINYDGEVVGSYFITRNDSASGFFAAPVPLPNTLLLFGSGLLGLAGWRRFRKG